MGNLHRVGAAVVGGFIFVFGLAGLAARPEVYSTEGPVVFGMTTNGLLAFASLAVGIVLLFAAVLGGRSSRGPRSPPGRDFSSPAS